MELTQLQYFMVLAKTEHMTRAAKLLNITQPTLSKSIANLEAELGVTLFDRIGHQIVLNHDGRVLRRYAQQVLADLDLTRQVMHDLHTGERGNIAIGSTMTFDPASPVRRYLADYFLHHPNVAQKVYTSDLDRLTVKLPSASRTRRASSGRRFTSRTSTSSCPSRIRSRERAR